MSDERPLYAQVVGQAIRRLRAGRGLNQATLAQCAGLSQSSLSRFELGLTLPDVLELHRLAPVLRRRPDELVVLIECAFRRARKMSTGKALAGAPGTSAGLRSLATIAVLAVLEEYGIPAGVADTID